MLPFEQFRVVYQFLSRLNMNYHNEISMLLFSIKEKNEASDSLEKGIEGFSDILLNSLRQSDIVTQNGKNQCIVILPQTSSSNINPVTERVMRNWKESEFSADFEVSFECGRLE